MELTFFLDRARLDGPCATDPDRDWRQLQQGEEAWILQTYLRLRRCGVAAELTPSPRQPGVVVFHAKQKRALLRHLRYLERSALVAVRGDLVGGLLVADVEIVQNAGAADGRRRFFIPHWPQPGLLPRDERRGDSLTRIAFKGYLRNLDPVFCSDEWRRWLATRGIDWIVDATRFEGRASDRAALAWPDYREIDAVLAVRTHDRSTCLKPATKLYNAWLAGAPALLGPEPAYRELRAGELDYLEVDSLASAQRAVTRLLEQPHLYRAMIDHGRRRATEFTPERTLGCWREFLGERLAARLAPAADGALPWRPSVRRRLLRRLEAVRLAPHRR